MILEKNLVIVSDSISQKRGYSIEENTAEGYSANLIDEIRETLGLLSSHVTVIDDIAEFAAMAGSLTNAIVIPCFFGPASRTSKTLVPAICEASGVPYIGADAYVQALCNDKYFSRLYAGNFGLSVSNAVLVSSLADIHEALLEGLEFPVVVKPNFGGGSNGIDAANLCDTAEEALAMCKRLYRHQSVPLIVESYMPGREVQVILADQPDGSVIAKQVGIAINGKTHFEREMFDLSAKKRTKGAASFCATSCIREKDINTMRKIYKSLGKVGFMRIDCRVSKEGRAVLLELSPDCSLSPQGGIYYAFREMGFSYEGMFRTFIECSLSSL